MRQWLIVALGAGVLMAGPALAGDPRGDHGGGHGGGHPPAPPPACCHGGNVNINVNAQASASAWASAGGYINARGYEFGGGYRGGGGVVYVGGGYGGDTLGGYGYGGPIYAELPARCGATASAPFGYAVSGMGRDYRNAPPVQPGPGCRTEYREDRAWGYEERRGESYFEESYREERFEYEERVEGWSKDRGGRYGYGERHDDRGRYRDERRRDERRDDRDDCRCDRDGRDHDDRDRHERDERRYDDAQPYTVPAPHDDAPEQPYISPEPYYPAPAPAYDAPPTHYGDLPPEPPQRPRQEYRQEPGERG